MKSFKSTILNMAAISYVSVVHGVEDQYFQDDQKDCFTCLYEYEAMRMCVPQGLDEGKVICCGTDVIPNGNHLKSYCDQSIAENNCLDIVDTNDLDSSASQWFQMCPQNTKANCGGQDVITAYSDYQTWGYKGMRYSTGGGVGWKTPQLEAYQTCTWVLKAEKAKWQKGNISVKFNKIDDGIEVTLWASYEGELIRRILPENEWSEIDVQYSVDAKYDLTVVAVPYIGATETDFEFDFWTGGEEWPFYLASGEQAKYDENGETMYLLTSIFGSLFFCCCVGAPLGCCFLMCCQKCKENKDEGRIYDTAQVTDLSQRQ